MDICFHYLDILSIYSYQLAQDAQLLLQIGKDFGNGFHLVSKIFNGNTQVPLVLFTLL